MRERERDESGGGDKKKTLNFCVRKGRTIHHVTTFEVWHGEPYSFNCLQLLVYASSY